MSTCTDCMRFVEIHSIVTPSNVWRAASERPDCFKSMKFLAQLLLLKRPENLLKKYQLPLYIGSLTTVWSSDA